MKIAIIGGSGKMGQLFARFLLQDGNEVIIAGRNWKKLLEAGQQLGAEVASTVEAVKNARVVIVSVPIDSFEEVIEQISPHIRSGQVFIDISSVKVLPVEIMHKHIKNGVVLGVHPMFGPSATGLTNHTFVLTPTSDSERALAQKAKEYLESRGAITVPMAPGEHDDIMSIALGLSHFIGLVSADTLLSLDRMRELAAIGGISYKVLLMLAESVVLEAPEFYATLQMRLPGMASIEELFLRKAKAWLELVRSRDKKGFMQRMALLNQRFQEKNPDVDKAHGDIYRLVEQF